MVSVSQWLPGLAPRAMPPILRAAVTSASTLDLTHDSRVTQLRDSNETQQQLRDSNETQQQLLLRDLNVSEAAELAQWSDIVIFDYITGNYDRVASMMVGVQTVHKFAPLTIDRA